MENVKLSSPWMTYVHKLQALFGRDPSIKISFDEEETEVKLYVEEQKKAEALAKLLPTRKEFGNVTLLVTIVPADIKEESKVDVIKAAFEGNPVLSRVISLHDIFPIDYVMFRNEVVQFYNDQLNDPNGNVSTLYEILARDILEDTGAVNFCTDTPDNEEWCGYDKQECGCR